MLIAARLLGAVLVLLAAIPLAAQSPPLDLLTPDAAAAAVWRAAGRRLQIELNELPAGSRATALTSDMTAWRTAPSSARTEAALALQLAQRWFAAVQAAIEGRPNPPHWPPARAPEAYMTLAPIELRAAWDELNEAAGSGASPQLALARAWRVRNWTLGSNQEETPFDALEQDAVEALAVAVAPTAADRVPPQGRAASHPPAATAFTTQTAIAGLMFLRTGGDAVSARGAAPDGAADIVFALLTINRGRSVASVELVPLDAAGLPCCGRRWSSSDATAEFLSVATSDGRLVNAAGPIPALGALPDELELRLNDLPLFQPGVSLGALIRYTDGSEDRALTVLPAWTRS